MVFCSSRSCGWVSISNCSVTSKSCASRRRERDLVQRPAEDRLADRAARLGEGVDRAPRRHVAGVEMHLGDAAVIAGEKAEQHVREVEAGLAVEPAHDAEIDDGDRAVGVDEHVAGMQIGMEKAVAEHLVEEGSAALRNRSSMRVPGGDQRRAVVDADARDPLERQHGAAGAPPIDPRHAEVGIARRNSRRAPKRPPPRSADPSRARPISARVCTTSTGFSRRSAGCGRSTEPASHRKRSRSRAKAAAMPGRSTLTATSCPRWSPRNGPARSRRRRSAPRRRMRTEPSSGAAELGLDQRARLGARERRQRSCSSARSAAISSPSRSARVDSIWPSLIKLGPSSSNAAASR